MSLTTSLSFKLVVFMLTPSSIFKQLLSESSILVAKADPIQVNPTNKTINNKKTIYYSKNQF